MAPPSRHPRHDEYLRELFENLEVGVLIADDRAFYVDANRKACEFYDRKRSEIVGHHLSEFIDGARASDVDKQWRAFLRDGRQSGVFAIQLPGGSLRTFQFQAQANLVPGLHCSLLSTAPESLQGAGKVKQITVCAWTKRVLLAGRWLALEDYLMQVHGVSVSHGICPDASAAFGDADR